jgi:hypothetical protein
LPDNQNGFISFPQHAALCEPIKKQLSEGFAQFKEIKSQNDKISLEVKWLRALAVVQASPELIRQADEIIGHI